MPEFNSKVLEFLVDRTNKGVVRIGKEMGVNYILLSNWIKGKNSPSPKNLNKLANYFNVDISLFSQDEFDNKVKTEFNVQLFRDLLDSKLKTLPVSEIVKSLDVSDRQLRRWYDDDAIPTNGSIDKICTYFNVKREDLFITTGDPPDLPPPPAPAPTPGGIHIVTVDTQNNPVIKLVPMAAQAGYLTEATDPDYWEELPEISISHHRYQGREMRAFEVAGDSMEPAILHSDWLFCARLEKPEWIQPGQVYIVVTPYALVVKRLHYQRGSQYLTCISDNAAYPEYEIATADIRELWQCLGLHRWQIPGKGMGK